MVERYEAAKLLDGYRTYDRAVDITSAFHWLYTATASMPATVTLFDRYPSIAHSDGELATPDFTVHFKDDTAIVGEIAHFALVEESVDALCAQLLRYDGLEHVPSTGGVAAPVSRVDVLLLVPLRLGTAAVERILRQRLNDPDHWYKPRNAPCIVQFAYEDGRYTIQRLGDPENGALDVGVRNPALGDWLQKEAFRPSVQHLMGNKTQFGFNNDQVDALYLATHLWAAVFPTMVDGLGGATAYKPIDIAAKDLADRLRGLYGVGRATDVLRALDVLASAGMAESTGAGGAYRIAWGPITLRPGEADLADAIAKRAEERVATGLMARRKRDEKRAAEKPTPDTLF